MDKLAKVRAQIAALQDATMDENKNFRTAYDEGKFDALSAVDALLDSLQEEPVSVWHNMDEVPIKGEVIVVQTKDTFYGLSVQKGGTTYKNKNKDRYVKWAYASDLLNLSNVERTVKDWKEEPVSEDLKEAANDYAQDLLHDDVFESFIAGAQWQKEKDSIPAKDLEEVISYLSKRYPEVSFAKLSRIAVYVAKWQQEKEYTCYEEAFEDVAKWKKEQMMAKAIDAEVLENYDGKVIKYDDRILDEKLSDCKVFDKVKVIVIKGE